MKMVRRWLNFSKRKFNALILLWLFLFLFVGYAPVASGETLKTVFLRLRENGIAVESNFILNYMYFIFDNWVPSLIISGAVLSFEASFTRSMLKHLDDPTLSRKKMAFFGLVRILTFAPVSGLATLLNVDEAPNLLKKIDNDLKDYVPEEANLNNQALKTQNLDYSDEKPQNTNNNIAKDNFQSINNMPQSNNPQVSKINKNNKPQYINGLKPFSKKNIGGFFIGEAVIIIISLFFLAPVIKNATLVEDLRKMIAGMVVVFLVLSVICYIFNCGLSHKKRVFKKCQKLKKGTSIEEVKYLLQNMPLYKEGISPLGYYIISYKTKQITKFSDFEGITFVFDNNGLQDTEISYRRTE